MLANISEMEKKLLSIREGVLKIIDGARAFRDNTKRSIPSIRKLSALQSDYEQIKARFFSVNNRLESLTPLISFQKMRWISVYLVHHCLNWVFSRSQRISSNCFRKEELKILPQKMLWRAERTPHEFVRVYLGIAFAGRMNSQIGSQVLEERFLGEKFQLFFAKAI